MKEKPEYYSIKCVISGNNIDIYQYSRPVQLCHLTNKKQTSKKHTFNKSNLNKTKRDLINYIYSNPDLNKFITLTFKDNIKDHNIANYEYNKFAKRISYRYNNFKYITVPEYQKRGSIHYHILSQIPFIKHSDLTKIWSNGYVFINRIDRINNISLYVSKYITKQLLQKHYKKKKFFTSKNITKPKIIYNDDVVNYLMNNNLKYNFTKKFPVFNGYVLLKNYTNI